MMKLKVEPVKKGNVTKLQQHNFTDNKLDIYPNGQVMR